MSFDCRDIAIASIGAVITLYLILWRTNSSPKQSIATMIIFGSGGHTSEMLAMIKELDASKYHPIFFVTAHV